ncbi:hypothetical protein [Streptomyces griseorubiginosus]|uniref:hypothetical protein n=1 Tax=Streptomyces griseorubiginosus TaxID=67304 RepID=UPI0036E2F70C
MFRPAVVSSAEPARYSTSTRSPLSYDGGVDPVELRSVLAVPSVEVNSTTA